MKQKLKLLLVMYILLHLAVGCARSREVFKTETAAPETTVLNTTAPIEENGWTEQDLLNYFNGYSYADPANRLVIDCAVIPDSAYGVYGVVQYITDDEEGCCFDFIRNGRPLPVTIWAKPSGKDTLAYIGRDTVCVELLDDNGQPHIFTIAFVENEEVHEFIITSE